MNPQEKNKTVNAVKSKDIVDSPQEPVVSGFEIPNQKY